MAFVYHLQLSFSTMPITTDAFEVVMSLLVQRKLLNLPAHHIRKQLKKCNKLSICTPEFTYTERN